MSEEIRFFLPGPTYVREEIRQAMTGPMVAHRSPAFNELYRAVTRALPTVFRTRGETLIITGSATLAMEIAVGSTVRGSLLNLTCGAFSERWHAISRSRGLAAEQLAFPWGEIIDPDVVRRAVRQRRYEAVTLAHNETSTGVLSPLREIARAIREESDALVLVDAVSSLGGAPLETDAWGLDVVLTGAQKALALPPGLAFMSPSERAIERAEAVPARGFYTDLLRYWHKHQQGGTITTPAIPQVRAAALQLARVLDEGIEQRWQRHRQLRHQTEVWAEAAGFRYASSPAGASPTVSCLYPPEGIDAARLIAHLAAAGFTLGAGYGQLKGKTLRIGHMGEVRTSDLEKLLNEIDDAVESFRREA